MDGIDQVLLKAKCLATAANDISSLLLAEYHYHNSPLPTQKHSQ